jgi:uncharacterized protein
MKHLFFLFFMILSLQSQAQLTATLNNIWIPMRDGELLQADVYIPDGTTTAEVILIQTPYSKEMFSVGLPMGVGLNINDQPYIWVIVDWRGFYGSSGADLTNVNRGQDGYDVCEWISQQSWFNQRIGTWGPSALGVIQYLTMREQHPNHTCAVPMVAHPHQSYDSYFTGGVLEQARLQQLDALGYGLSPVIMSNVYYNTLWSITENNSWYPSSIEIPTLQIGGWYDHNIDKMMTWYKATRQQAEISVREQQYLLVGPWVHGGTGAAFVGSATQGELSYPNAANVSNQMAWDFMNYFLLDSPNNWQNTPKITYYETGKNLWATTDANSLEITNYEPIYLSANNGLVPNSNFGNSSFISLPTNPSPTIGGATLHTTLDQGPYDQNDLDQRSDVLMFSSNELLSDITISGRTKIIVYVSSTVADCDIAVRLADIYPDGRSMLITDGIRRMRFRNGYTQAAETFMTTGEVYALEITLPFTNYTWKAGHKLKLYVSGNNAIRYHVNRQDGGSMYTGTVNQDAEITIHHNATYPSRVEFPGNNNFLGQLEIKTASTQIHPNPTTEFLQIQSQHTLQMLQILDLNGRELIRQSFTKEINTENLNSGTYFLVLTGENDHQEILKFIKE